MLDLQQVQNSLIFGATEHNVALQELLLISCTQESLQQASKAFLCSLQARGTAAPEL